MQWLPGVEISTRGKVTKLGDGSKECNFFATIAADGKVRKGRIVLHACICMYVCNPLQRPRPTAVPGTQARSGTFFGTNAADGEVRGGAAPLELKVHVFGGAGV